MCDEGLPIIVGGDFNEDLIAKPNRVDRVCLRSGLEPINNQPTHITDSSSKYIDIVLTNSISQISHVCMACPSMSNHSPVIITHGNPKTSRPTYSRVVYQYNRTDWDSVNLSTAEWPQINNESDLDVITDKWTTLFKTAVHKYTPQKTVTVRPEDKKWITPEIKNMIKRRNTEFTRAKKTGRLKSHSVWGNWKKLSKDVKLKCQEAKEKRSYR